jgi:hypothetical protein
MRKFIDDLFVIQIGHLCINIGYHRKHRGLRFPRKNVKNEWCWFSKWLSVAWWPFMGGWMLGFQSWANEAHTPQA